MSAARKEDVTRVYNSISGGEDLLRWFKGRCDFHDAEILDLELNRRGLSRLRLLWWNIERTDDGLMQSSDHAVVVFDLRNISDLQLDGFSQQNVIGSLILSVRERDAGREAYYDFCATDADYHLQLEHCYGLSGFIRCGSISVHLDPGRPSADIHAIKANAP